MTRWQYVRRVHRRGNHALYDWLNAVRWPWKLLGVALAFAAFRFFDYLPDWLGVGLAALALAALLLNGAYLLHREATYRPPPFPWRADNLDAQAKSDGS